MGSKQLSIKMTGMLEQTKELTVTGVGKTKLAAAAGLGKTKLAAKKLKYRTSRGVNWIKLKCNLGKIFQKK